MIPHYNIIQGTPEWHEIRYRKLGGTSAKSLLVDSDTLLKNIGCEFIEPFELEEDGFINADMQRGIELEPMARQELIKYSGLEFIEVGWCQSKEVDLIGISPDSITSDLKNMAEIKCPGKEKHFETLINGVIPSDHIYQCLHCFVVNPLCECVWFVSFRPECQYPLFVRKLLATDVIELTVNRKKEIDTVRNFTDRMRAAAIGLQVRIDATLAQLESI